MADPDDDRPLHTRDVSRLADLGVRHAPDDHAVAVADRALGRSPVRTRRRWTSGRPLVLALVATVATGSAAVAAGIGLLDGPSRPLAGDLRVPGAVEGSTPAGRYRITVAPTLSIGEAGWCLTGDQTAPGGTSREGGSACGEAGHASTSVIAGLSGSVGTSRPGQRSRAQLIVSIVDARVAALRLRDGRVITARPDRSLPDGWRSLVWVQDHPSRSRYLGPDGRAAPSAYAPSTAVQRGPQAWRRAGTGASRRPCSIRSTDPGRSAVLSGKDLVGGPRPIRGLGGRPFLSCATALVAHGGRRYTAAVLVDAGRPGRAPARLPGSAPRDGREVTVPASASHPAWTARRTRGAWVVVQGPDTAQPSSAARDDRAADRRAILDDLR